MGGEGRGDPETAKVPERKGRDKSGWMERGFCSWESDGLEWDCREEGTTEQKQIRWNTLHNILWAKMGYKKERRRGSK